MDQIKEKQAEEAKKLLDAFEEWLNDNKDRICFSELIDTIEGYREYYGEDGDFFVGEDIKEKESTEETTEEIDEINPEDEVLEEEEQLISEEEVFLGDEEDNK